MITIECTEGSCAGRLFELDRNAIVFGRSPECDVWLDDSTCSRQHARLELSGEGYVLTDLDSTNGVLVNGVARNRTRLRYGDRFVIGRNTFVFLTEEEVGSGGIDDLDDMINNTVTLSVAESRILMPEDLPSLDRGVSSEELERLRKANRQMQAVYSLSRAISSTLELRDLYKLIADNVLARFEHAERVCVFVLDRVSGEFSIVRSQARKGVPELSVSREVLERVRAERAGLLASDVLSDERFDENETLIDMRVRSLMCVPLSTRDRVIGAVYVDNATRANCFEQSDLELLTVFGNQMATSIENASLYEQLEISFYETVRSLSKALEAKDRYTRGHSGRVAFYAAGIGRYLELSGAQLQNLKIAAELHDIGKIALPEEIINAGRALTDAEFEIVKRHPLYGVEILRPIRFLEPVLPIVLHHHERYNGEGYPDGLAGEEIPIEARVLNLADAFDAMTTQRPYNAPKTFAEALRHCQEEAGKSFDAACVDALHRYISERFARRTDQPAAGGQRPRRDDTALFRTSSFSVEEVLKKLPAEDAEDLRRTVGEIEKTT